jgi:hypothetical protein
MGNPEKEHKILVDKHHGMQPHMGIIQHTINTETNFRETTSPE